MISFFDLTRQNTQFLPVYTEVFQRTLRDGVFILGEKVAELEYRFSKYVGTKYAVGVASGTDALTLSLLALDIGPGDEVILPANSYPSAFGIAVTGAKIVLSDIDQANTLDAGKLQSLISKRTKAIIPVHMYGMPADMNRILAISKKYSIPVIEDCAQSVGAEVNIQGWKKTGSMGIMGCFSFYPTKNLGAFGDGGMIVTNDKKLYEKLKLLRMYGEEKKYKSVLQGRNSRLDELQAALLLEKLKHLSVWNRRRCKIASEYESRILNEQVKIQLPIKREGSKSVYHLFVIRSNKRDELQTYLAKNGIQTAVHYPVPIHLVDSFKSLGYRRGDFPHAESLSREALSIPLYPELSDKDISSVIQALNHFR